MEHASMSKGIKFQDIFQIEIFFLEHAGDLRINILKRGGKRTPQNTQNVKG